MEIIIAKGILVIVVFVFAFGLYLWILENYW